MKSSLAGIFITVFVLSPWAWASGFGEDEAVYAIDDVQLIENLQVEADRARTHKLPLLIVFSADHCPYCHVVEEEFLEPMLRSGDYTHRVIMRKIDLDSSRRLLDFDGRRVSARQLAKRYRVKVTPTVLLLDAEGRELTERLVGISTPDFYGGYLDAAIDEAYHKLNTRVAALSESP